MQRDSAGGVGNSVETLEVTMNESRDELVKALQEDHSLDSIKKLADRENGYKEEEGLVMKIPT